MGKIPSALELCFFAHNLSPTVKLKYSSETSISAAGGGAKDRQVKKKEENILIKNKVKRQTCCNRQGFIASTHWSVAKLNQQTCNFKTMTVVYLIFKMLLSIEYKCRIWSKRTDGDICFYVSYFVSLYFSHFAPSFLILNHIFMIDERLNWHFCLSAIHKR